MENRERKGEVKSSAAKYVQILTAAVVNVDVRDISKCLSSEAHHLATDVNSVNLPEYFRQCASDATRTAAKIQHPHVSRPSASTHVAHIVKDILRHTGFARLPELLIRPVGPGVHDVMSMVLYCAAIPVSSHLLDELVRNHFAAQHCSDSARGAIGAVQWTVERVVLERRKAVCQLSGPNSGVKTVSGN